MKVDLTGAPETMPATLYARALDARGRRPILGDGAAADAVSRIEYGFRRTGIDRPTAAGVAMRAKLLGDWTSDFLARHLVRDRAAPGVRVGHAGAADGVRAGGAVGGRRPAVGRGAV